MRYWAAIGKGREPSSRDAALGSVSCPHPPSALMICIAQTLGVKLPLVKVDVLGCVIKQQKANMTSEITVSVQK